jgi:hypothetical protein
MNIIQFLFALIKAHVLIPDSQLSRLELDGEKWYKHAGTSDDDPKMLVLLKEKGELWYVQVGLAILFIFANKWVSDFMSAEDTYEEEEEE